MLNDHYFKKRRRSFKNIFKRKKVNEITNSWELYCSFRDNLDEDLDHRIMKDLKRTAIGNLDFKVDVRSGENKLYNVLNAYAHYDPEVNYC